MKSEDHWIIVDTETTGLCDPVLPVEIAAQRMQGWRPVGRPFRALLDHDIPIEPQAEAIHNYSRGFLRAYGKWPADVYAEFLAYADGYPWMVAHNLAFDWNRVLLPELCRKGLPRTIQKGFCSLTLARRVLPESPNFKLETLNVVFQLTLKKLHGAVPDVEALVRLFSDYYQPRLEAAGVTGFNEVARFSRRNPVAKCRALIRIPAPAPVTLRESVANETSAAASVRQLAQLITKIMADGVMTTQEFLELVEWLQTCPDTDVCPISYLAETVETIIADGIATTSEQTELEEVLKEVLKTAL